MFAGGLSMFFRKAKADWNIVNDKDNNIVNLYMSIAEKYDEFCHHIKFYVKSRTQHQLLKKYIKDVSSKVNPEKMPDVKRAARYYYLVKSSFNNNPQGTFSKNSEDWVPEQFAKDLVQSRNHLLNIVLENLDFRVLVDKYTPQKGDLWYIDPPYFVAAKRKDYYIHTLQHDDHLDLLDICNRINDVKGRFMVSYDDNEKVYDLYKKYNIEKIPVIYAGQTTNREYKNELVITNYSQPTIQESLFDGDKL